MKAIFNSNFTEITNESRLMQQKLRIIQVISQQGHGITVPDICKELKISAPTGIKLVNELQDEGFLAVVGKKETLNGRKPSIYALKNVNFYALSVEILLKRISVGIIDSRLNTVYYRQKTDFNLENNQECLDKVESFILDCLNNSGVSENSILGMGVGITGRVKNSTGESLNFFNFMDKPLGEYFSGVFDIPVFLNNDTRCFGQAERIIGKAKDANHAIVINLSRGLGTSLIIDNKIVNGGMGFAGELGHMQFGNKQKMCLCGKKGCLGNDVGGFALEENFMEKIAEGEKTIIDVSDSETTIRYDEIMAAALDGDDLSIKLVQEMGYKLGHALGNIINLLNPELIIIGGKFAKLKDLLLDPVKTGITSSALVSPLHHCNIEFSELGDLAGIKGAGALVFEYFELIKTYKLS
ncbi:MAG: ROK family protein [Bacteroidales bacterium]|nr:ROK family protein [Bacteroidales bacterium]